jgi:hypothetical protein
MSTDTFLDGKSYRIQTPGEPTLEPPGDNRRRRALDLIAKQLLHRS